MKSLLTLGRAVLVELGRKARRGKVWRELETDNADNSMSGYKEQRYGAVVEKARGVKSFLVFFIF